MFDLIFCECSYQSFILFLIKEKQKNITQLFLRYFFELNWIKTKNFLLIILNYLSSIYGPFLIKNFFYSIRLKNFISYSEYLIERCTEIANIIFRFKSRDMLYAIPINE